ncbi:RNA polymerase sigma-70 factor, ECF subfamily [Chitinophaga rupis]|uniref:RNA polymerase sigma-70 factor, ECF subfamily n=1 Tax=Chitinophaga rupis TaxID=573321 RepID=A0A1H7V758_9BACT|nr:RNA polymerase sigma-70 factor, ECF subfamily [Chitinophaga rupis]
MQQGLFSLYLPLTVQIIHTGITGEEERHLLADVAAGSWNAFSRLYELYSPLVLHYLQIYLPEKQDVEEIGQEVFLKVWKRRETLITIRSFKNYIFIITRNALNDFLRARQARLSKQAGYERDFVQPHHYSPDDKLITDQYEAVARAALAALPEKQRLIFELRTRDEKTIQEIANEMGMSLGGVHKSLQQSIAVLKDYLGKHGVHFLVLLFLMGSK